MPSNPDVVRVTVGDYISSGNRTINVRGETIKFQQSEKAQLKYPGVTSAAVTKLEGAIFRTSNGADISPIWTFDSLAGEIIALDPATNAPVSVYGGARVDYTIRYSRYIYTPETTSSIITGFLTEYGSILAIKNQVVADLSIDAGLNNNAQYVELYQVYSYVVIANSTTSIRDVYEKPPNYPTSGDFPTSAGPDPNNSVAVERVHEIGYVNKLGFQRTDRQIFAKEKPYTGTNFTPDYILKWQSAPDESYEDAFNEVDKPAVLAELQNRYPGLST
jgi:hypothetical protein